MKQHLDFTLTRPVFRKVQTQIRRHVNLFRLASQTGIPHAVLCAVADGWEPEFHRGRPSNDVREPSVREQWQRAFLESAEAWTEDPAESQKSTQHTAGQNCGQSISTGKIHSVGFNSQPRSVAASRVMSCSASFIAVQGASDCVSESSFSAGTAPAVSTEFSASSDHRASSSEFVRCPTCGGLVQLPCRKCQLEHQPRISRRTRKAGRFSGSLAPNLPPDCYARYLKIRERKAQEELELRARETATEWIESSEWAVESSEWAAESSEWAENCAR